MKRLMLLVLVGLATVYPQEGDTIPDEQKRLSYLVELNEFYDSTGIIFTKDYRPTLPPLHGKKRFTPAQNEVRKAEEVLAHLVEMMFGTYRDGRNTAKTLMRTYRRQYAGIENEQGEKVILIVMVKTHFRGKKEDEYFLGIWKGGLFQLYDTGTDVYRYFLVNLSRKELTSESDPLIDEKWFIKNMEDYKEN